MKEITIQTIKGPHNNMSVLIDGNTKDPTKALILFHGRFSNGGNMMRLTSTLSNVDEKTIIYAPTAIGNQWYPKRFIESTEENEPYLSSALNAAKELVEHVKDNHGITEDEIILGGFSQGACLAAEYAARNPRKYKGICVFSGGLIGEDEEITKREYAGDMEKTPVYIGCDENDPHIPKERVELTSNVYEKLNADTTLRIYSGLGHTIHPEGIDFLNKSLMDNI